MEAEDLEDETLVPPGRGVPIEKDATQKLLDEIRTFVDNVTRSNRFSTSVDQGYFEELIGKLREFDQRVTSMERAAALARAHLDIAKAALEAMSNKLMRVRGAWADRV